jgi:hypothetical protein
VSAQLIRRDYKPRLTIAERRALWTRRAADDFTRAQSNKPKPEKSKAWYFWLGWMAGAPFWILTSAVIFALVLYWTSPDGVARVKGDPIVLRPRVTPDPTLRQGSYRNASRKSRPPADVIFFKIARQCATQASKACDW